MSGNHVDKNFDIQSKVDESGIRWFNALGEPFSIHGVFYDDGKFRRIPESVAKSVSPKVHFLHANTSGGRIRFRTNSKRVAIRAKYAYVCRMTHFALTGSAGFDLYAKTPGDAKEVFVGAFMPPYDMVDGYESVHKLGDGDEIVEVIINMPLYSDVTEVYVGVDDGSELLAAEPYPNEPPIVYYGNSITQGACASRPGNVFATYSARCVGRDFINLGFSGAGCAEDEIAEYIAGLDMRVLVYDYDHNAPSPEFLEATHERMFLKIREKHPDLPVVMLTRTSFSVTPEDIEKRKEVVKMTYARAVASGDKNVYFIDGSMIYGDLWSEATVERLHPSDLGQVLIGKEVARVLEVILKK